MTAVDATWRRVARTLTMGSLAFLLISCASVTPTRMVPDIAASVERKSKQRVRVMPVSGTLKFLFGGFVSPSNEQLRESLTATLKKTGVFAGVSPSAGDINLTMSVLSTEIDEKVIPIRVTVRLLANYKFTTPDGALIWSETYASSFGAGDFAGSYRMVNANEGAVRENLKAFAQGVRERFRQK